MGKGRLIMYKILACYTLLSFSVLTHSAPETALIAQIPGFSGNLPSKHYSGYVSIFCISISLSLIHSCFFIQKSTKDYALMINYGGFFFF